MMYLESMVLMGVGVWLDVSGKEIRCDSFPLLSIVRGWAFLLASVLTSAMITLMAWLMGIPT